jgi:predicted nuclease with TOPRIM domain
MSEFVPFHLREEGKSYTLKLTDEQIIFSLKERIETLENDNIRVLKELNHCREELNKANDHIKELEIQASNLNEEKKLTPLQEYQERKRRLSQVCSNSTSLKTAVARIEQLKKLRKSLKQPEKVSLD